MLPKVFDALRHKHVFRTNRAEWAMIRQWRPLSPQKLVPVSNNGWYESPNNYAEISSLDVPHGAVYSYLEIIIQTNTHPHPAARLKANCPARPNFAHSILSQDPKIDLFGVAEFPNGPRDEISEKKRAMSRRWRLGRHARNRFSFHVEQRRQKRKTHRPLRGCTKGMHVAKS